MIKLEFKKMERIEGGVSRAEYCSIILNLYANNGAGWSDAELASFYHSYEVHCVNNE